MEGFEGAFPVLEVVHQFAAVQVVDHQQQDHAEFDVEPHIQNRGIQNDHQSAENDRQDHSRPSDDVVQPPLHQRILFLQSLLDRTRFGFRLFVIDKQPDEVKQARKPCDHEDEVQCLEEEDGGHKIRDQLRLNRLRTIHSTVSKPAKR